MTLPTGTISFNQINTELGRTATAQLSLNDAAARTLAGVGSSGTISMNHLQGKSHRLTFWVTISTPTTSAFFHASLLTGYIAGLSDVTLFVNAGVLVNAGETVYQALWITGFSAGDTFSLVNNGTIAGRGGNATTTFGHGLSGGVAIKLDISITISGSGYIGGGGGAGGALSATQSGGGGAGGGLAANNYGGNGGWTIPGVGGAGGRDYSGNNIVQAGQNGTAGGGGAGNNRGGDGGSGGAAGGNGVQGGGSTTKGGGGGGGWGASGGGSTTGYGGAYGGKAIDLRGHTVTWIGGFPSTRVFGAIS